MASSEGYSCGKGSGLYITKRGYSFEDGSNGYLFSFQVHLPVRLKLREKFAPSARKNLRI